MAVLLEKPLKIMLIFLQLYLFAALNAYVAAEQLKAVVIVYRHGDRTPIRPYPNDPYKNASYWPVGFGQLTNKGKMQQYELGKWLRLRYNDFLSVKYTEKEVRIVSTDVDRTLMSAEANLAGLYPPKKQQIWNPSLDWQPIPIHTRPEIDDAILAMKKPCPKYQQLLKLLLNKNEYFRNISRKNHDLYAYLTRNSGTKITNLEQLEYLYNTLMIEKMNNFTLPEWTLNVFPDRMRFSAELSFATSCYTKELARLKSGLWYQQLIEFFKNHTIPDKDDKKMLIYSGHDLTIANLLNTMGAFDLHCPPYASTLLYEFYSNDNFNNNSDYFINIYYKNTTTSLQKIVVNGCDFNCKFDDFIRILNDIIIDYDQWLIECHSTTTWFNYNNNYDNLQFFIVVTIILLSCLFLILFIIFMICKYFKNHKHHELNYQQLPNDEVA